MVAAISAATAAAPAAAVSHHAVVGPVWNREPSLEPPRPHHATRRFGRNAPMGDGPVSGDKPTYGNLSTAGLSPSGGPTGQSSQAVVSMWRRPLGRPVMGYSTGLGALSLAK